MNKEKQLNSDKKILASLEAEYKRAQRVIHSIRALVTDLNFEELIPDSQERCLMVDELQAYDYIRTNLMNRIRFYRARVKREESTKDWSQYKKTDNTYIGVDVSDKGDHSACCQVCGDAIATHHCGQDADCDDACCQAGSPCGRSAAAKEPVITGEGLKELVGMQVVSVNGEKCDYCVTRYNAPCVKLELVGGYMLCLAPLPNSIVTE